MFVFFSSFFINVSNLTAQDYNRKAVLDTAYSYLGTKEATGKNDGPVERFQKPYGAKKSPYCAFFVKYCMDVNGISSEGIDGRAVSSLKKEINKKKVTPGDIFYVNTSVGTGHIGYVYKYYPNKDRFVTIEGNYSNMVTSVTRKISKSRYSNWIQNQKIQSTPSFNIKKPNNTEPSPLDETIIDKIINKTKNKIIESKDRLIILGIVMIFIIILMFWEKEEK